MSRTLKTEKMKKIFVFAAALVFSSAAEKLSAQSDVDVKPKQSHRSVFFSPTRGSVMTMKPQMLTLSSNPALRNDLKLKDITFRNNPMVGYMLGITFNEHADTSRFCLLPITVGYFYEQSSGRYAATYYGGFLTYTVPIGKFFGYGFIARYGHYEVSRSLSPPQKTSPLGLPIYFHPVGRMFSPGFGASFHLPRSLTAHGPVDMRVAFAASVNIFDGCIESEFIMFLNFSLKHQ